MFRSVSGIEEQWKRFGCNLNRLEFPTLRYLATTAMLRPDISIAIDTASGGLWTNDQQLRTNGRPNLQRGLHHKIQSMGMLICLFRWRMRWLKVLQN